jgi:hypothetical protein
MEHNKETDIFEDSILIHPNMNNIIISEFNKERIQELLKHGLFLGEVLDSDMLTARDIKKMFTIDYKTAVIQILSIREDFESLKLSFKFADNGLGDFIKKRYIESPQSYILHTRAVANADKTGLNLITFDLIYKNLYPNI